MTSSNVISDGYLVEFVLTVLKNTSVTCCLIKTSVYVFFSLSSSHVFLVRLKCQIWLTIIMTWMWSKIESVRVPSNWSSLATASLGSVRNKQTSIISCSRFLLCPFRNPLPSFMPSSSCMDREQSPALIGLHRGLNWIARELKEAGWFRQPSITSHLPHFSLLTSPAEYRLSGLHLAVPRWRVFCSLCTPVTSTTTTPPLPSLFQERLHSREKP